MQAISKRMYKDMRKCNDCEAGKTTVKSSVYNFFVAAKKKICMCIILHFTRLRYDVSDDIMVIV